MGWDSGTEAEHLTEIDDFAYEDDGPDFSRRRRSQNRGGERPQPGRWRCLQVGCNPRLNEATAADHRTTTGHRVAAWPVRSDAGKSRARARNKSGYYDKYNVGAKSARWRGIR